MHKYLPYQVEMWGQGNAPGPEKAGVPSGRAERMQGPALQTAQRWASTGQVRGMLSDCVG